LSRSNKIDLELLVQKTNRAAEAGKLLAVDVKRQLEQEESLAIGEVAGRDSAAAIIKAASFNSISSILPTIVFTGTEYGNWETVFKNIEIVKGRIEAVYDKQVYSPILLGDAELWWALNGRYLSVLNEKFGFCSPCLGCHLYMHLVRVPLARELKCSKIISGERVKHDKRVKINQTAIALNAYKEVLGHADIELILPIRDISSGDEISALVGGNWEEGEKQLKCILSGNYRLINGEVTCDENMVKKYLDKFLIPVGKNILEAWDSKVDVDYISVVRNILSCL